VGVQLAARDAADETVERLAAARVHDLLLDPFTGSCPYHGDCLEGLASGQALRERWGCVAAEIRDPQTWELEAKYLAFGVVNLMYTLAPARVILGGGVMRRRGLLEAVRTQVVRLTAGYCAPPRAGGADDLGDYIVSPKLGDHAGLVGAVELARDVLSGPSRVTRGR